MSDSKQVERCPRCKSANKWVYMEGCWAEKHHPWHDEAPTVTALDRAQFQLDHSPYETDVAASSPVAPQPETCGHGNRSDKAECALCEADRIESLASPVAASPQPQDSAIRSAQCPSANSGAGEGNDHPSPILPSKVGTQIPAEDLAGVIQGLKEMDEGKITPLSEIRAGVAASSPVDEERSNLEARATDDGTWITFTASSGKSVTLRVETLAESMHGPIRKQGLLDWCNDRQRTRATQEAAPRTDKETHGQS